MPLPPTPNENRDPFSTVVSAALDQGRTAITQVGLRTYRVFLLIEMFDGAEVGDGVMTPWWEELLPYPKVDFNPARVTMAGGGTEVGQALVYKVSRRYTRNQLVGARGDGGNLPPNWRFSYVLAPLGQTHGRTYAPSSEPSLRAGEWRLAVRPTNRQFVPPTPDFTGV